MSVATSRHISHDPISNLKIKVHLKRLTSSSVIGAITDAFANPTSTGQDIELVPKNEEVGAAEEAFISWQEKLLSQREILKYGDLNNCTSVRDRQYNSMILQMRESNDFQEKRIFTCIGDDPDIHEKENIKITSNRSDALSFLEEKIRQARPAGRKQSYLPLQHPVHVPNNDITRKSNHVQQAVSQRMLIMADIGRPRGMPRLEDEKVLCTITVDANHVVSVSPAFSSVQTLENSDGDVWEYCVDQVKQDISEKDELREKEVMEELFSRHASLLHNMVGTTFTDPPDHGATRVHVFGEIARATRFDANNLFVNYSFDLPLGWCVEEDVPVRGLTHRSKIRETKSGGIAHLNHPFELTLFNTSSTDEDRANRPRLFVEVRSVDSWERVRLEGYGYLTLPATPGCHTFNIDCWRPEGADNATRLRRFFIGGTPELSDVRYTHVPANYAAHPDQSRLLGKFGFRTMSTGSVEIKLNVVHQTMPSFSLENQKFKRVALKDKYGRPGVQMALLDAIESFSRARKHLETMRTTLEPSLSRLARNVTTEASVLKKWKQLSIKDN